LCRVGEIAIKWRIYFAGASSKFCEPDGLSQKSILFFAGVIHPGKPQRSPDWKARSRLCHRPTTAEIQFVPPFLVKCEIGTMVPVSPASAVGKMTECYPKISPDFSGKW
jgi:hypothetical protein